VRHVERVRSGELLDDQQEARVTIGEDGVPDERLMVLDHVGDIAETQRAAARSIDRHLGQIARGRDGLKVLDAQPLVRRVDEASVPGVRPRGT
jgi:hypothetical protein